MIDALGGIAVWSGCLFLLIGAIWFVITAFQEGILWGLGVMFVPLVPLIYLILGWSRAKRPFGMQLLGLALVLFGAFVLSAPIPGVHHY